MKDEPARFWLVVITLNVAGWIATNNHDINMLKDDIEQIKLECQISNDKAEG